MEKKYLILVEGEADKTFLKDYIKYNYNNINENIKIEINSGKIYKNTLLIYYLI